jgi:hypothetical protein
VGAVCPNWARTDLCGGARGNSRPYREHALQAVTLPLLPERTWGTVQPVMPKAVPPSRSAATSVLSRAGDEVAELVVQVVLT